MTTCSSVLSMFAVVAGLLTTGACDEPEAQWAATEINDMESYFSSVWGAGPDDVYVVGGVQGGVIYHWNGATWDLVELAGNTPALIWVFGFASDDVYAVGERGVFLHYDGATWEELDSNTSKPLWGLWGTSPNDLWMVGGNVREGRPTIRHWNGQESEVYELEDSEYSSNVHALFKVWGTGDEVFAVGQRGTIMHYRDGAWSGVAVEPATTDDFISVWGQSAQDMIVVGGRGRGVIARPSASGFAVTATTNPLIGGLSAAYQCDDDIWVGSDSGAVGRFSKEDLSIEVEYHASNFIHSLWSNCSGTVYAVGGFFNNPPASAVAAVYK